MSLSRDHQELLSALAEHEVRYLVIGGYAVGVHSEPRATGDLDVLIWCDAGNSRRVFQALAAFGAPLGALGPPDFNDGRSWFRMGIPPARIEVLQAIDGVTFEECWSSRVEVSVNGAFKVPVIGAEKLIQNKVAAGRLKDLADVEALRETFDANDQQVRGDTKAIGKRHP